MTKVEELRDVLRDGLMGGLNAQGTIGAIKQLDSLIAASHAEGVADGIDASQRWIDSEFNRGRHVLSLPKDTFLASLLAPDKEDT